jgi:hypothetical protein
MLYYLLFTVIQSDLDLTEKHVIREQAEAEHGRLLVRLWK